MSTDNQEMAADADWVPPVFDHDGDSPTYTDDLYEVQDELSR